ncbi:MAG: AMP-binding protein [Bacteroidetes bacterium]|nr:AMP-binding protein [Bacteroidota bacterium]
MSVPTNLTALFEVSIRNNWDNRALSDYGGSVYTYRDVGARILAIHDIFRKNGITKGDKIVLLGKNSANWGIIYIATVTFGAVIVPVLPDFKPADVHYIATHSDACLMFVEEFIFKELNVSEMPLIKVAYRIQNNEVLYLKEDEYRLSNTEYQIPNEGKAGITPEMIKFSEFSLDDIAVISYTSGTTGFSKGVVLQHKSLYGNILYAHRNMPLKPMDKILSFLPLAHTYGCAFEFLFPFTLGCDITFLTKTPSPKIIMQAFQEIRPALILSVPLVIEKIYKTQILPLFRKPAIKILLGVPGINILLHNKIRKKLYDVFGGNFKELVIGGAAFNIEAERFFRKIKFPFTVGYGMTECGPLMSYASWKTTQLGASGRVVDELEMKIDSPEPYRTTGEILVRGSHVMLGYYKNEEATKQVIDEGGWLHSGDLGVTDKQGNIYIKGRSKSMILGPSGKNIYPEELESHLNNRFMVMESLVLERDEKLVALIYPDYDAVEKAGHTREELDKIFKGYIHDLNHHVPKYMMVSGFEIHPSEFEKTPKRSIKRFLYN